MATLRTSIALGREDVVLAKKAAVAQGLSLSAFLAALVREHAVQETRFHAMDNYLQRFALRFRGREEGMQVTRQDQDAEPVGAVDLDPVDRDVLHAGARIPGDHQAGGDVGAMIVFAVRRDGQQRADVGGAAGEAVHDLLHRRFGHVHLTPAQRLLGGRTEVLQQSRLRDAHRFGDPGAP